MGYIQLTRTYIQLTRTYIQLTGFVLQGPRALQCLTLSEDD